MSALYPRDIPLRIHTYDGTRFFFLWRLAATCISDTRPSCHLHRPRASFLRFHIIGGLGMHSTQAQESSVASGNKLV
jgi:hypothetical protein